LRRRRAWNRATVASREGCPSKNPSLSYDNDRTQIVFADDQFVPVVDMPDAVFWLSILILRKKSYDLEAARRVLTTLSYPTIHTLSDAEFASRHPAPLCPRHLKNSGSRTYTNLLDVGNYPSSAGAPPNDLAPRGTGAPNAALLRDGLGC
jgi:hypothetical protein